ncbi:MAG: hypothetical protein DME26_03860, partial [Verrucomicrobia bacterium]
MKHKLITLVLSIATTGLVTLAQDNTSPPAAVDKAPAFAQAQPGGQAQPAAAPAAKPGQAGAPDEVVPLIVIDEVPLTDAIRNLARQSNLNFQFDPRITATNQPTVSIRFENVTAAEALQAVLENYNLSLIRDPRTRIARITPRDPKADEPL